MNRYEMDKERENFRTILKKMFSITEDAASNEEIRDRILSGGKITGTNMVVMICAILIASVGLNTNSIAVIIGAMLISPLMGSILAISYGTVSNDAYLIKRHSFGFAVQIVMSVVTATIYFLLSPISYYLQSKNRRNSCWLVPIPISLMSSLRFQAVLLELLGRPEKTSPIILFPAWQLQLH